MALIKVFLCAIGLIAVYGMENPNKRSGHDCNLPLAHYRELGCDPVYAKLSDRCPTSFQCPFMARGFSDDKCYYKNNVFSMMEAVPEDVIEHSCSVGCTCTNGYNDKAELTCAQVECPEEFDPPSPDSSNCVKQYKVGQCCSFNEICDAEEISKLATCTYNHKVYREGERFFPDGTCKECVCTKDFDGHLKGPWCHEINCGVEIYHSSDVHAMCAPVYLEKRVCCPIQWQCPNDEDKITYSASTKSAEADMKCKYGDKQLDVGDKVVGDDKCVTCSCMVPPMLTCIRALNC